MLLSVRHLCMPVQTLIAGFHVVACGRSRRTAPPRNTCKIRVGGQLARLSRSDSSTRCPPTRIFRFGVADPGGHMSRMSISDRPKDGWRPSTRPVTARIGGCGQLLSPVPACRGRQDSRSTRAPPGTHPTRTPRSDPGSARHPSPAGDVVGGRAKPGHQRRPAYAVGAAGLRPAAPTTT